jgi:hypothetical protein
MIEKCNKQLGYEMKHFYKILLLLTVEFLFYSCNTTEPTDNLKPGRRDYTWTVDTLDSPNNELRRTWASSENDAWAVGPGGVTPYDRLWHFDGNEWQPYPQALSIYPECIYGFAQNDVWMGGSDGKVFHYDDNGWRHSYTYIKLDAVGTHINDLWGSNSKEIYAIGRTYINQEPLPRSFILHFNGSIWKEIYFSSKQLQFFKVQKENNQLFLSGIILTQSNEPDTLLFFKFENNLLSEIYRNTMDKITFISLSQLGSKTYFLIGRDLCQYINGKFATVISFSDPLFGYQAFGRNEKDIFISMKGGLAHYNGENIEYLFRFSNSFTSPWPYPVNLSDALFFPAHDKNNDLNLILRGVLNN